GIESLAILKQATSDYQASMLGIALNLKAKNLIEFKEYNKYQYIILKMNNYLLDLLKEIHEKKRNPNNGLTGLSIGRAFGNPEFIGFGFLKERDTPTFSDAYPDFDDYRYVVTEEFEKFYKFFIEKEECIE
ncbi:hypothetical protein, partial [Acinetobacter johnsonii]|uniref:hypothetical protein n=1 Tax=Acinetobacter johnsonii TaxID=40214 RepID=UPI002447D8C9